MSRKKTHNNARIILDIISSCNDYKNDEELAKFFNVKGASSISSWRTRNNYAKILLILKMPELITNFQSDDQSKIQTAIETIKRKFLAGEKSSAYAPVLMINESHAPFTTPADTQKSIQSARELPELEISDTDAVKYAGMALEILKSKTRHARALKENILSFYEAVDDKRELTKNGQEITKLKEHIKTIEERLPKTGE
jgi:hypothetical protein